MADFQQALPTNYPDLNTLFERMPGFAAMQAGGQSRIAQANDEALQQAFAAQEAYNAQRRPFELTQLGAQTDLTKAQGRNIGAEASLKEGTLASDIATKKSANKLAMSGDEIKQIEQVGDLYRQAGAAAATETDPYRKVLAVKKILGDHVDQSPQFDQWLLNHAPTLHQQFTDMGNNVYNASRTAVAERQKEEASQQRTETQAASAKELMNMQIEAGRFKKNTGAGKSPEQILASMGYEKASVYYDAKAEAAEEAGDSQAAANYRAQADKMKQAYERAKILAAQAAAGGKVDVGAATGLATNPPAQPQGFNGKEKESQSPTDIIKKAFGDYNPDEYDYRIDPTTGQPQRKKKVK